MKPIESETIVNDVIEYVRGQMYLEKNTVEVEEQGDAFAKLKILNEQKEKKWNLFYKTYEFLVHK